MTNQTVTLQCLGGSPAGISFARFCTLTLAAILVTSGAVAGFAQAQPDAAQPAKQVVENKPASEPAEMIKGGYLVHQTLELGGIITQKSGSDPMWATMVNEGTGMRVISHSLELRTVNPSKTPFFDTLSTSSFGYGGEPYDVSRLSFSKGRIYDFEGSFRRDRNYFDYNLLDSSLLSTASAATPALVPEPDSLHLFNTVRRNTDTMLTLFPLSRISFRAGFNHGTHEGPSYTTAHAAGDVQLYQWFRNASDTYTAGVDVKLAKRTTVSYDQFFLRYRGDSTYQITGNNYATLGGNGVMESLGVDTLATATCGTSKIPSTYSAEVVNGFANPYCSGTIAQNQVAPTHINFPTEQLRFSSHYWDKVSMNGRILYSGATGNVNNYVNTVNGLNTRTELRAASTKGMLPNGHFVDVRRDNLNADFGIVADLNQYLSVSDTFDAWNFRTWGNTAYALTESTGVAAQVKTAPYTPATSILTPLSDPTITTATLPTVTDSETLDQKIGSNTFLVTATITPEFKLSGGWRFKSREITDGSASNLTWHENGALFGAVIQPSQMLRFNINMDTMTSKYSSGSAILDEPATAVTLLPSNTFTRSAPNQAYHLRARATIKPAKWVNLAVTGNDYSARNNDPNVNHQEHNHDLSFAAQIIPNETVSLDFNYAHDDVFSETDLCYIFVGTATYPVPAGAAASSGTCLQTSSNPEGTLPTAAIASQLYLGNGYYHAPSNYFSGSFNFAPSKYFKFNGGARLNSTSGQAEQLNPLMVPGALDSRVVSPFADLMVNIAKQWAWHGNWVHHGYSEGGPVGPTAPRNFHGDVVTLSVKYAF